MDLNIIHQSKNFLVVDKPPGLIVDRSSSSKGIITLQDKLEKTFPLLFVDKSGEFGQRSGLVHRLDKDTSGLLLVAKNEEAFDKLKQLFVKRQIRKEYLGLVHGRLLPQNGSISLPLSRSRFDRRKFGVFLGGRKSKTDYQVSGFFNRNKEGKLIPLPIEAKPGNEIFSFCHVFPLTGRTHQIRIHLKQLGFPIVADQKYAGRKVSKKDLAWCSRQFLHAHRLKFINPFNGQQEQFSSPLPSDLGKLFA